MKSYSLLACAAAGALALPGAAQATDQKTITNAQPASAASSPSATRLLKFNTHHQVPVALTLRQSAPVSTGWRAQYRFAGQTDRHTCTLMLPKTGQTVRQGETATGQIVCTTPWQLYDNGLSFEAFEDNKKVADGTLRP
jgi:hypothetical protein